MDFECPAKARKYLDAMDSSASLMEGIVSDMLDFERIDSGRMELVCMSFSLARLLNDATQAHSALAGRRGIQLILEPIPAELHDVQFVGDRRRLLQCIGNGLSNALKFSQAEQTVTLSVEAVRLQPEWEWDQEEAGEDDDQSERLLSHIRITIKDEGAGISKEEMAVLAKGEAFSQVGRGQLQGNGGTGLGLTIVRSILKLHSGSSLRLSSPGTGQGTTFIMDLRLPRTQTRTSSSAVPGVRSSRPDVRWSWSAARASGRASRNASHAGAAQHGRVSSASIGASSISEGGSSDAVRVFQPGSPPSNPEAEQLEAQAVRCLYAEDDAMVQLTVSARLFARAGIECDLASDGQDAIDKVAERAARGDPPYQLILMDNQMPRVGGAEATRTLRQQGFSGQIIGMTGDPAGSLDRDNFEECGLDMCVDKTMDGLQWIEKQLALLSHNTETSAMDRESHGQQLSSAPLP